MHDTEIVHRLQIIGLRFKNGVVTLHFGSKRGNDKDKILVFAETAKTTLRDCSPLQLCQVG